MYNKQNTHFSFFLISCLNENFVLFLFPGDEDGNDSYSCGIRLYPLREAGWSSAGAWVCHCQAATGRPQPSATGTESLSHTGYYAACTAGISYTMTHNRSLCSLCLKWSHLFLLFDILKLPKNIILCSLFIIWTFYFFSHIFEEEGLSEAGHWGDGWSVNHRCLVSNICRRC